MKKVLTVLAAALFLGACHCAKCTTQTAGRYTNKPACCCKHKNPACRCANCAKPQPPAPAVKLPPPPAPKIHEDAEVAAVANVKTNEAGAAVLSFKEPINFRYNSDEIEPESAVIVEKTAAALKKYPDAKIRVAGYTDSLGDPAYNMDLSERRAHAVAQGLVDNGVPAANISYIGYGAANPVATNKTAAGRYQNRRVELEVINQ